MSDIPLMNRFGNTPEEKIRRQAITEAVEKIYGSADTFIVIALDPKDGRIDYDFDVQGIVKSGSATCPVGPLANIMMRLIHVWSTNIVSNN